MKFRVEDYEQEPVYQKTVKTNQGKPKRVDESKSKFKDHKQDYQKQRMFKRQEEV